MTRYSSLVLAALVTLVTVSETAHAFSTNQRRSIPSSSPLRMVCMFFYICQCNLDLYFTALTS